MLERERIPAGQVREGGAKVHRPQQPRTTVRKVTGGQFFGFTPNMAGAPGQGLFCRVAPGPKHRELTTALVRGLREHPLSGSKLCKQMLPSNEFVSTWS